MWTSGFLWCLSMSYWLACPDCRSLPNDDKISDNKFVKFPNFIVIEFSQEKQRFGQFSANFPPPQPPPNANFISIVVSASLRLKPTTWMIARLLQSKHRGQQHIYSPLVLRRLECCTTMWNFLSTHQPHIWSQLQSLMPAELKQLQLQQWVFFENQFGNNCVANGNLEALPWKNLLRAPLGSVLLHDPLGVHPIFVFKRHWHLLT